MNLTRRECFALTSTAVMAGLGLPELALADDATPAEGAELPTNANDELEFSFTPEDADLSTDGHDDGGIAMYAASGASGVVELWGQTRYETSREEAFYSYPSNKRVIVASGGDFPDSLAGSSLAGVLDCPIVMTSSGELSSTALEAINRLGATEFYILGGTTAVSAAVEAALSARGVVRRLAGPTRFETQLAIYRYGKDNGLWRGNYAIVASGMNFPDALSASPLAFALTAPIFFVNGEGELPQAELDALKELSPREVLVLGGTAVVSDGAFAAINGVVARGGSVVRLWGQTRYETSAAIARYAVENCGFTWDGLAFTSGIAPFDALGGGVVQGKEKSVLLLADEGSMGNAGIRSNDAVVNTVKFFGGEAVFTATTRAEACKSLGMTYTGRFVPYTSYKRYNLSLERMLQLQAARGDHSYAEYQEHVDPNLYDCRDNSFFAFAVLDNGYSGLTAKQIDTYIANNCTYWEGQYGWRSTFRGMGQAFINASRQSGLNEAYLLAHAKLESAWGCSYFAHGWSPEEDGQYEAKGRVFKYYKGTTYYNFFGIGAYDNNPSTGAHIMSIKEGWTTPEKTIIGSAKWLSDNYVRRRYKQNTPYLQRFDCAGCEAYGSAWHEYCTGLTEFQYIGFAMYWMYHDNGIDPFGGVVQFEVPVYAG